MSKNIYVISTQDFTGKSAVCVALMHRMQQDGFKVGYIKPFSSAARVVGESRIDEDARFVKEAFDLPDPIEDLAPVVFTNQNLRRHLTAEGGVNYAEIIKQAAENVARGRDVVVMEGGANFREGYVVGLSPFDAVELLQAKVVVVVGYRSNLQVIDDAMTAKTRISDEQLLGIIINFVPEEREEYVRELIVPYLTKFGIKTLAVLPNQSILHSISIGEINEALEGQILCYGCDNDLVENLVVASMGVEHSIEQFQRVQNKAVLVGADRPDIHMDALETSTKVLILTGNIEPAPQVRELADLIGVAIVMSKFDTLVSIEKLEAMFDRSRFHQIEKVHRFEKLFNQKMDYPAFYKAIEPNP
jgi:BioD-like phosphotransacetylase family protein